MSASSSMTPQNNSSSSSSRPRSSSSQLPSNHPHNLRKQARATLDPSFSVRSYLGAAAALLEKAESSDRQHHLEQAFVNYIKAANVASFITKHPEWQSIQSQRNPTYFRYQDLMQKITEVVSRATRIEATLKQRAEASAALQAQQLSQQQQQQQQQQQSAVNRSSSASSLDAAAISATQHPVEQPPPPPAEPGPAKQLRSPQGIEAGGDAASALVNSSIQAIRPPHDRAGPDDQGQSGSGTQTPVLTSAVTNGQDENDTGSQVARLADRLSALRSNGVATGTSSAARRLSEPVSPTPPTHSSGNHSLTSNQDDAARNASDARSLSNFKESYPSLDDFERDQPSQSQFPTAPTSQPGSESNGIFPSAPSHVPGSSRRPLPNPPPPPTDLSISRNVPEPFEVNASSRPETPTQSPSVRAKPPVPSRPASLIPGSPKTNARSKPSIPRSRSESISEKPALPRGNHIRVEELWAAMNPGFERVPVGGDESSETKMVRRRALQVLLVDLRSRQEFDLGRVGGGSTAETVCLEAGVFLRRGMSSDDIEDKLLLAPPNEQRAFANRNKYDVVIFYDRCSRILGQPNPSKYSAALYGWPTYEEAYRAWENFDIVAKAIYEHEFKKALKVAPMLLVGGWESWSRKVNSRQAGLNGHSSGPPADLSSRRSTVEEDVVKKQRRQGFVMPDGSSSQHMAPSQSTSPSAYRSPPSLGGFGSQGFSGLSKPAKAYQSPGTPGSSAPPAGAPSFPPSASSNSLRSHGMDYFPSQPSLPYGGMAHPPPTLPSCQPSGSFDYPQLRSAQVSSPQPPPAAMPSNGVSNRSSTSHAHNQSLSAARGASLDIARRPQPMSVSGALGVSGSRMNVKVLPDFDDLRIGLTGLKNVGNSCYQNSTLQCLSATIPLAKFMLDGSYKKAINKVNPLGTQGALAESFAQLIKVMWSEQYTFVSPVTFREAIGRFISTFRGYDQHDSQEFLAFLLDGLHEDLNYVVHKPPPVEMTPEREEELETLPQQVASVKEWTIYRQRNDSLIVDWFQGQFRNKMTCLTCGKTSTTYNAFMYLSLPIPSGRSFSKVTLFQCLDAFVKEEVLDKADAWNCPSCKKPRKATKRLSISRLPMILLIHLKRFSFKGPFTDKIETQVSFPIQGLDLTNYVPPPLSPSLQKSFHSERGIPISRSQQPPFVYDLYGVTHHFGSLNTGHYTASIKSAGKWWYCDDSRTVPPPNNGNSISEGEKRIMSNSPYVLWLRRRP
ncbi:unnamed protein product [Sympodiomycopsis kandeliae]